MPEIKFTIKYNKNEGLAISPSEFIDGYLFGLPMVDKYGNSVSQSTLKDKIVYAQMEIEKSLGIKLYMQIISEDHTFYRADFLQWGAIQVSYPVVLPFQLVGKYNQTVHITFPKEWLSSKRTNDDQYHRLINIVPANTPYTPGISTNMLPYYGLYTSSHFPNYWTVDYCTGFNKIPKDIINMIGKLAAINALPIIGDLFNMGISSQSIGVDGLSQSVSLTRSAEASIFGSRIKQYTQELKDGMAVLKSYYSGLRMISV
jgi:hypothetical protein